MPSGETELVVVSVAAPVTAPSWVVTVLVVVLVSEPEAQATRVLARAIRAAAKADWIRVLRMMNSLIEWIRRTPGNQQQRNACRGHTRASGVMLIQKSQNLSVVNRLIS